MKTRRTILVGLLALALVGFAVAGAEAEVRWYYVQAEDVVWDFTGGTGLNQVHCMESTAPCGIPDPFCTTADNAPCGFKKVRYVEYTDGTFATPKPQPQWLGIIGPIIRAQVGDVVKVHFRNRVTAPGTGEPNKDFGMHPHGFRYLKKDEGAFYTGVNTGKTFQNGGVNVPPGGEFIYTWRADADSSPGPGDPSSLVWWYHSHVDEPAETNLGLLGPIIIYKKGFAKKVPATPTVNNPNKSEIVGATDTEKEFVTVFFIFDERAGDESGLMHGINGYIFGNLKGLVMNKNDRVRWYLLGMGNEVDLHTPHWHGKVVTVGGTTNGQKTDVIDLLPATMKTATMVADNPGEWLFHCHVADHLVAGMITTFQILP